MDGSSGKLLQSRLLIQHDPTAMPPAMSAALSPDTAPQALAPGQAPRLSTVMSGPVRLAVKQWGDPRRPTIVLVHGYPDNSAVWHPVAELLARDFHVVAYDVRGAGQSDRPARIRDYKLDKLKDDFVAVIDQVSPDKPVHLVAHDWGSIQSWEAVTEPALQHRILSFTSCSGPCLDHIGHWFRQRLAHPTWRNVKQLLIQSVKSWYIYFFQLPLLPGLLWRAGVGRAWPKLVRLLEGTQVETNPTQVADGVHGVQLYRANMLPRLLRPRNRPTTVPVQVLVPRRDLYVSPWLTEDLHRWTDKLWRREYTAGHWMPASHPGEMAGAIRRFVQFTSRPAAAA